MWVIAGTPVLRCSASMIWMLPCGLAVDPAEAADVPLLLEDAAHLELELRGTGTDRRSFLDRIALRIRARRSEMGSVIVIVQTPGNFSRSRPLYQLALVTPGR